MSVVVHALHLRDEMARRGWSAADLARESRLSQATISAALASKPVNAQSVALIANALTRVPAIGGIDSLIRHETPDIEV
jgi:lambda repressor-like predicted transcriptional regulator